MASSHDDLDAVRTIVEALEPFDSKDRQRIVRWALEKLGDVVGETIAPRPPQAQNQAPSQHQEPQNPDTPPIHPPTQIDIKAFVAQKSPINDMQFAATVAYYYAFEVSEAQRKEEIGSNDLQEACRLTGRERLHNPGQTLRNAAFNGLLDKGTDRGYYKINTVGENLVALTLPSNESGIAPRPKKPAKKKISKKTAKKAAKKKVAAKKSKNVNKKK